MDSMTEVEVHVVSLRKPEHRLGGYAMAEHPHSMQYHIQTPFGRVFIFILSAILAGFDLEFGE